MEPEIYISRYETLMRSLQRLEEYYSGKIDTLDSFNGPKDFVFAYFDSTYALKEALKPVPGISVEKFIICNESVALGIDISNKYKHVKLDKPKTNHIIGTVNTGIHIFDPKGNDRTELTIEIDGDKKDCLKLAKENFDHWREYLLKHSLITG